MGVVWTGTPPFGRHAPGRRGYIAYGAEGDGGGWAATCCGLGGRAGGARRSASLPFVLAGTDLSGTLQGVDGAAGANHINAFGANGNVRLDADCIANTDKWPAKRKSSENGVVRFRWEHSDFKNVAYFFVYKLFDRIVGKNSN